MRTFKLILIAFTVHLFFISCKPWKAPSVLVGQWQSKQKVTVRNKQKGDFVFINAPDSVLLQFSIDEKGNVTGHLGNAVFENCKVFKNRNDVGRKMNLATDYVIKGSLKGTIFPDDPHLNKEISAPFNVTDNKMEGSLFQRFGWDLYPITGFDAIKE